MLGETLSNYRVISEIGRGGMARVFVGEHQLIGTRAAIKVLLPALSQDKSIVARFFNEARAAGRIKHPGIVEIYDFGYRDGDGTAYIVMELVSGESLNVRLAREGPLPIGQALVITRHIASCLGHAHDAQIIHRDLKPENVMLTPDSDVPGGERVKLLDFGIAKLLDAAASADGSTRAGTVLGTPAYMAPEQSGDAANVDSRADLYSLGCMLYEMVAGQPPFPGTAIGELLIAHRLNTAPPPSQLVAGIPPEVDALVTRLLAKAPDDRVQSARELVVLIDQIIARLGITIGTSPGAAAAPDGPVGVLMPAYTPAPRHDSAVTVSDSQATVLRDSQVPPGAPRTLAGYESYTRPTYARSRLLYSTVGGLALAGAVIAAVLLYTRKAPDETATAATGPTVEQIDEPGAAQSVTTADAAPVAAAADAAPLAPPAETVTIKLKSRPLGADVYMSGKRIGATPLEILVDKGGRASIVLKASGYADSDVELEGSKSRAETVRLARIRASVSSGNKDSKDKDGKDKDGKDKDGKDKDGKDGKTDPNNGSVNPFNN